MNNTRTTIGNAARITGVNIETIRYYQRIGLIDKPNKPLRGHRHYPAATLDRIRFIKRAQQLGFSLKEIRRLLQFDNTECQQTRELAEQKLALVHDRIQHLQRLSTVLQQHIQDCCDNTTDQPCPLITSLLTPRY